MVGRIIIVGLFRKEQSLLLVPMKGRSRIHEVRYASSLRADKEMSTNRRWWAL